MSDKKTNLNDFFKKETKKKTTTKPGQMGTGDSTSAVQDPSAQEQK